jgi:hypothetical protein
MNCAVVSQLQSQKNSVRMLRSKVAILMDYVKGVKEGIPEGFAKSAQT